MLIDGRGYGFSRGEMAAEGYGEHQTPTERRTDAEIPVVVLSCSRLGMQANPPGRRLIGRWRR